MRQSNLLRPLTLILLSAAIVSIALGQATRNSGYQWFDPIIEVRAMLLNDHVAPPSEKGLQEAILRAMAAVVNDPYTTYVPMEGTAALDRDLRGTYSGIGAEISVRDGRLTIVAPLDDSPALEAGLIGGDAIVEIDGRTTDGITVERAAERLLGEAGTTVRIRVRHADGQERDLEIIRRRIVTRTVRGLYRDGERWRHWLDRDAGIAYIRVGQFIDGTTADVAKTLHALRADGMRGLVLDLRFNGGGVLGEAIALSDLFLDGGTIVSVRNRKGEGRAWSAQPAARNGDFPEVPLLVLVNGGSASASEIVAGALLENGRAVVLGTRTFGKGSVQEVRPLGAERGTIKLTTATYHLPSGRNIDRAIAEAKLASEESADGVADGAGSVADWGVDPTPGFHLALSLDQQRTMFERRRRWEMIAGGEGNGTDSTPRWSDESWLATDLGDPQLAAALRALRLRLADGDWQPVGDEGGARAAHDQERAMLIERRDRLRAELTAIEGRLAGAGVGDGDSSEFDTGDSPQD